MKKRTFAALVVTSAPLLGALAVVACTGDDDVFRPTDAGAFDRAVLADRVAPADRGPTPAVLGCGDAGGAPPRALLIQGNPRQSELAVVNLTNGAVDGRLGFDGGYGATSAAGTEPYLLGGESDHVIRLDAREPWRAVTTFDVRGDDLVSGGSPNANPVAVIPVSCTKAYVLRFNRDRIAIIDQSSPAGGSPTAYIDLAPLKAAGDPDVVEMTSAVYVPSKKRVFVLLGNADLGRVVTIQGPFGDESKLLCRASLKPSIVAIDVDTDKIVSLGGTAPGGGIALEGYNPPLGTPLVYDAVLDRLLVLQAGCNEELGDGGPGGIIRRRVEEVRLATGAVKTLLSLDANEFPSTLAYADASRAALAFFFEGFRWDPSETTLGARIGGGIDLVAVDGRGGFFGTRGTRVDGGPGPVEVVTFGAGDGGSSVLVSGPFTKLGGYVAGLEAFPHR